MIKLIYNDKFIIVPIKPAGVLSERGNTKEKNMPDLLKKATGAYKIDTVHRLDKAVGGVMVYSKNQTASASLSKQIAERKMVKEYLAAVHGTPSPKSGEMCDFLFKDSLKCKSFVVKNERKGAKYAKLEYSLLGTVLHKGEILSLVKIRLHTGRTHQIRVQFSSRKMPLVGDRKYGSGNDGCDIALWSYKLAFSHPKTGEHLEFKEYPAADKFPWNLFKNHLKESE